MISLAANVTHQQADLSWYLMSQLQSHTRLAVYFDVLLNYLTCIGRLAAMLKLGMAGRL